MSIELVRTVEHVYDDDSVRIAEVSVITFRDADEDKAVIIREEHGQDSVMINNEAHAKAMIRAIKAAGEKIGWGFD